MASLEDRQRSRTAGRELRYRLTLVLRAAQRPLTVPELLAVLEASGFRMTGRPSKTISDALRWEIAHGRVIRIGRSRYVMGAIPPSTVWSIHRWMRTNGSRNRAADRLSL